MEKVDEHQITEEEKQKAFDVIFTSSRSDVGGVGGTDEPAGNYSLTLQFHSVIMGFTALLFWFFFFWQLGSPHRTYRVFSCVWSKGSESRSSGEERSDGHRPRTRSSSQRSET